MKGFIQNAGAAMDFSIPNVDTLTISNGIALFSRKSGGDTLLIAAVQLNPGVTVSVGEESLK